MAISTVNVKVDVADLLEVLQHRYLDIVFDSPSSDLTGGFVEVESPAGTGVRVGTWIDRGDGYWALRLTLADFLSIESGKKEEAEPLPIYAGGGTGEWAEMNKKIEKLNEPESCPNCLFNFSAVRETSQDVIGIFGLPKGLLMGWKCPQCSYEWKYEPDSPVSQSGCDHLFSTTDLMHGSCSKCGTSGYLGTDGKVIWAKANHQKVPVEHAFPARPGRDDCPTFQYIGDSLSVAEKNGCAYLVKGCSDGSNSTIRMDPPVIAHFLEWLEDTELLFKSIPRGWSDLIPEESESQKEILIRTQLKCPNCGRPEIPIQQSLFVSECPTCGKTAGHREWLLGKLKEQLSGKENS